MHKQAINLQVIISVSGKTVLYNSGMLTKSSNSLVLRNVFHYGLRKQMIFSKNVEKAFSLLMNFNEVFFLVSNFS